MRQKLFAALLESKNVSKSKKVFSGCSVLIHLKKANILAFGVWHVEPHSVLLLLLLRPKPEPMEAVPVGAEAQEEKEGAD